MKKESHHVDAFREGEGPGVLGRLLDIVERQGHAAGATAINARSQMVDGDPSTGRLADFMSTEMLPRVFDRNFLRGESQELRDFLQLLHAETDDNSGIFGVRVAMRRLRRLLSSICHLLLIFIYLCSSPISILARHGGLKTSSMCGIRQTNLFL